MALRRRDSWLLERAVAEAYALLMSFHALWVQGSAAPHLWCRSPAPPWCAVAPTAAGSHRLQGRMGSDGPLQGSTHFTPTQVPAPGPWWQETLSHIPCPQHRRSDFLEILQTDRQQWEPCLLPTATWLVPQKWQTEVRCWHLFRGGKGSFWTIWCSHLGKKWVLLKSWENSCWAHLCPLGSSLSIVPSQGWWGWA